MRLVFDVETNGYLEQTERLHCLVIKDIDTGDVWSYRDYQTELAWGLDLLANADVLIGHNIVSFDLPAIKKVYPTFETKATLMDTLLLSRVLWSDIKAGDFERVKKGKLPGRMVGRYSLEAWGYRLGNYKGDYQGGFDEWSQEMQTYCEQDVEVTHALYSRIEGMIAKHARTDFVQLEHDVRRIVDRQQNRGVGFDEAKANKLYGLLIGKRHELESQLKSTFPPWFRRGEYFVPKRDNAAMGYTAGAAMHKVSLEEFNPQSRDDVADRLIKLRGWDPKDFGKDGKPTLDDEILSAMPYPEAPLLAEYFTVTKRIGTLDGKVGLLRHVKDGAIHGQVVTNGAVTGRMTHMKPNMNVPKVGSPYGEAFRSLFIARPGYKLVGCDADALEARCLAGYMHPFDGGAYIEKTLKGDKSLGTDTHSDNARALGLDPQAAYPFDGKTKTGREIAKTWFYAFIYGAADWKLGFEVGHRGDRKSTVAKGRTARAAVLSNVPALAKLVERVEAKIAAVGYLVGLDGRRLPIRKANAALNTLLQSAGAVFMKRALVILDAKLQTNGLVPGVDYEHVLNIHDELQTEVKPEHANYVATTAAESIKLAGEYYDFICPLAGDACIGNSWADTH